MSKTWETLFNLTSFMKYLLTKDLPDEKLEAPSYVLDSLYDLLIITSSWIDKIKPVASNNASLKNQLADHSAQLLLSARNSKNIEENVSQTSIKSFPINESPLVCDQLPPAKLSNEKFDNNLLLENTNQEIPDVFMNLSKEMINGRPLGFYCRPCDEAFCSKKEWDNHIGDRLHTFLIGCEIKTGSCVYCKLIIFASNRDINNFFKYHETYHSRNCQSLPINENTSETETSIKPSKSRKHDSVKTDSGVYKRRVFNVKPSKSRERNFVNTDSVGHTKRVADADDNYNSKSSQKISSVFIELDKKMHSGQEIGFYCYICDNAFEDVNEWKRHFQAVYVHNDQYDSSCCFEKCESCGLVIFAVPSIQKWYKSHHMCGHYCFKQEEKSKFKSSVESLQSTAQSQENSHASKNNSPYQNNQSGNTYKIMQQFMDFSARIHANNLEGHFYCRPCNATLSPEEWDKHSGNKKHLELMSSKKFKNWKGTCSYCFLTIIGTRDTVKYYMEFHSEQHNRVVSYELHKVSSDNNPKNFTSKQPRRRPMNRKIASPISVSTLGDEEDGSDFEESSIKNEPNSVSPDASGGTSWYASSREEQLHDSICQLIDSRTKENYTSGNPQFGALCTLCEFTVDNGFDWQDHLTSAEHCQRKTIKDRQGYLSDINVYIFGSMNVFEKYKSLVKGNWSFIEN